MFSVDVVTASTGERRGGVEYRNLKITRAVNRGMTVSLDADSRRGEAAEISLADRKLHVYDTDLDEIRFNGRIGLPHVRTPGKILVTARSPVAMFANRFLARRFHRHHFPLGTIADDLFDQEAARWQLYTRLKTPLPAATPDGYVDHNKGDNLLEAFLGLTTEELDDGLYFVEQPLDGDPNYWTEVDVRYPDGGVDSPARFAYLDARLGDTDAAGGNCVDYEITFGLPVNGVHSMGAPGDDGGHPYRYLGGPTNGEGFEAAGSVVTYGLLEAAPVFSTEHRAKLIRKGLPYLTPYEIPEHYRFTPLPGGEATVEGGMYVPRLWRDFDVGDVVTFDVRDGATERYDVRGRVLEATVTISDEDSSEILDSITLEAV